jgi:hypothetical protein
VLFTQGSFRKDLWIDRKEIPVRNRKSRSGSKETKNDPVSGLDLRVGEVCVKWYQSLTLFVYFRTGKVRKNLSHATEKKRQANTRSARGKGNAKERGRQVPNPAMEREMRDIHARLVDMEIKQRRTTGVGDVSESESEDEAGHEGEEVTAEDAANECLIRVVARMGAREKMDIPVYEGNLDVEELLDWIRALDTYFDYEDVEEDKKVKHVVTRLKGHATLWWDELQADRCYKGKQKIKSWDRMVAKMKAKFIPRDYQITLFRRMQNLRQKLMSVKEYTEEFYKLNIRAGHRESDDEKVARYMNGLDMTFRMR